MSREHEKVPPCGAHDAKPQRPAEYHEENTHNTAGTVGGRGTGYTKQREDVTRENAEFYGSLCSLLGV